MARKTSNTLTEAEQKIMHVLWAMGEASVRDVADALTQGEKPVAYNTVLTILGILHRKKYVRYRLEGRAHIYRPAMSESGARGEAFDQLVSRFFGGSKNAFAQYLVDEEKLDPAEIARLKAMAGAAKKKKG